MVERPFLYPTPKGLLFELAGGWLGPPPTQDLLLVSLMQVMPPLEAPPSPAPCHEASDPQFFQVIHLIPRTQVSTFFTTLLFPRFPIAVVLAHLSRSVTRC